MLSLTAACLPVFAVTGFELQRSSERAIDDQLTLVQQQMQATSDASLLAENYYIYNPGGFLTPTVIYGNDIRGAATYAWALEVEENAGRKVLGGTNADFFNMSTGICLGACVKNGIVCSSEHLNYESVGFDASGNVQIGRMDLNVSLFDVDQARYFNNLNFNKSLEKSSGLVLFSNAYSSSNAASGNTFNIWIAIEEGEPRIGQTVRGTIEEAFDSDEAHSLDADHLLLSVYIDTAYQSILPVMRTLAVGDSVEISFSAAEGWEEMQTVIGAERRLIKDGVMESFTDQAKAPRTALGIMEDGRLILYTADGRNAAYSAGLSYAQLAQRMLDLGAVQAVNLDGGGSTQMHLVWPGYGKDYTINKPSEDRRCGNYLVFTVPKQAAQQAERLYLYRSDIYLLAGASTNLTLKAADRWFNAVDVPAAPVFSVDTDGITIEENRFITTPGTDALATVTARAGGLEASADIHIIGTPDSISILGPDGKPVNGVLKLSPAETVQLSASATYKGLALKADPDCFSWSLDGGVGGITATGSFTAVNDSSAKGTVTVTAGDASASVEVVIDKQPPVISWATEDGLLNAGIRDNVDEVLSHSSINVLIDGTKVDFSFEPEDGSLSAVLPEDGLLHHVVIEAGDSNANWSRASIAYEAPGFSCGSIFEDMPDTYWATRFVEYMQRAGILNGKERDGIVRYDPQIGMTRQEFAAVMVRMLGTDTSQYEEREFDWTDMDQISAWALPSVKASAALGIMNGKGSGEEIRFDPLGQITRQEVMTVIGRMQKGDKFGRDDLASFSDAADVADWARSYVQSLVAQKIITGSDGKLNPTAPVSRAEVAKIIFECM